MHISNALGVAENPDVEGIHNIIVNVLQVVLVDDLVISPYEFCQFEPKFPLEIDTLINYQVCMPVISRSVRIFPIPEIVCG